MVKPGSLERAIAVVTGESLGRVIAVVVRDALGRAIAVVTRESLGRAIALLVLAVSAAGMAAPGRACEARIELDPPEAWVGEQVTHEIVVTGVAERASIEWLHPPGFPDVRAVPLPPPPATVSDAAGTRRQRRALHAARPGRIVLPATPYRCVPAGGDTPVVRSTPEAVLIAKAPPAEGRPASWRGLVGPVTLQVQAASSRTRVGESVRVVASLSGPGLMRQAGFAWPMAELAASGVAPELFVSPASHREQPGLRHVTRRIETIDIVPHAPGELWVPAIEVAWLDPETGHYASSSSEAFAIEVRPEAPPVAGGDRKAGETDARADRRRRPASVRSLQVGAALAVAAAAVLLAWRRRASSPGGE